MGDREIDESLYSRQLYVLGHDAMNKMLTAKVLLIGSNPLALEIAKNVCLSGVHSLTLLHSDAVVKMEDLGCNYYFTEPDIGKNQVQILSKHLSELNPYVPIHIVDTIDASLYAVIVCTERIPNITEIAKSKLILAFVHGFFSQVFNDFGNHVIIDKDGEACKSDLISHILINDMVNIYTIEDHRHQLEVNDTIQITNSKIAGTYKITNINSPFHFSFPNPNLPHESINGGTFTEVKVPHTLNHLPYAEAVKNPQLLTSDWAKDHMPLFHLYQQWFNNQTLSSDDTSLLNQFKQSLTGQCAPMFSVIGGIVAQETLKKISNKFTPISQFLYFDCRELASDTKGPNAHPRYTYQSNLALYPQDLRIFIIGSGAIGCELLKISAMLGISNITITDMDTIEKSNLNRQFLFRSWDVGKLKSETAKHAIQLMNPSINITAHASRMGPETENQFNTAFYKQQSCLLNALDNWEARRYMDQQAILHNKALFESGTLGTKGNTQVILPGLTESFTSSNDPQEESIPMCTLHHFPNKIHHTIQWARDIFDGYFVKTPQFTNQYLTATVPNEALKYTVDGLKQINNYQDCVEWAILEFNQHFNSSIQQLLHNFPLDTISKEGVPFWNPPKLPPTPISFNPKHQQHLDFVVHAAHLKAETLKIKVDNVDISKTFESMIIPDFEPLKMTLNGTEMQEAEVKMEWPEKRSITLVPLEFEKDDATNHHIQFITSASNCRAMNYQIPITTELATKQIAGKIIPAIATTTATISGLIMLEMLKYQKGLKMDSFKNGFVNLALPFFGFAEPIEASKHKYNKSEFTLWDKFHVHDMTLKEFIDFMKEKHGLEITMMSVGVSMMYSFFMQKDKRETRMKMMLTDICKELKKQTTDNVVMEICANDLEGEDVEELPCVVLMAK